MKTYLGDQVTFAAKSRRINIAGKAFGHLIALRHIAKSAGGQVLWKCRCNCGSLTVVASSDLRKGKTISCGCVRSARLAQQTTHGEAKRPRTPEYRAWCAMRTRCTNPRVRCWPNYGGRGIRVCGRWQTFEHFLADLLASIGRRPSRRHSIDRIDVNGHYAPGNIRWATAAQQNRNRRRQVR